MLEADERVRFALNSENNVITYHHLRSDASISIYIFLFLQEVVADRSSFTTLRMETFSDRLARNVSQSRERGRPKKAEAPRGGAWP